MKFNNLNSALAPCLHPFQVHGRGKLVVKASPAFFAKNA